MNLTRKQGERKVVFLTGCVKPQRWRTSSKAVCKQNCNQNCKQNCKQFHNTFLLSPAWASSHRDKWPSLLLKSQKVPQLQNSNVVLFEKPEVWLADNNSSFDKDLCQSMYATSSPCKWDNTSWVVVITDFFHITSQRKDKCVQSHIWQFSTGKPSSASSEHVQCN